MAVHKNQAAESKEGFCAPAAATVCRVDPAVYEGKWLDVDTFDAKGIEDPLAIAGMDHVEIYTGNAQQTAFYFSRAFGFNPVAYRGPETGYRDGVSYVMQQNEIRLIVSGALSSHHPISEEVKQHGMTARDLALEVPHCEAFYYEALRRGATAVSPPMEYSDASGTIKRAAIKTYGNVIHSLVERTSYSGTFWPGYVAYRDIFPDEPVITPVGLKMIDHVVGNVELGKMDKWVSFYEKVLDFKQLIHFTDDDISTEYSALMSKVVHNGSGKVKFPINEPAEGKRKSQIEEYLDFHEGPGVQHIALRTDNIIETVSALKKNGVRFLRVPATYYDDIPARVGEIKEDLKKIAALGVLVDRDDDGYLLQLFTKPTQDRPTLFFEIIQREGSQGFGAGNFKALFEAIEREQALRGNL